MWTYTQNSGAVHDPTGKILCFGYSGMGIAKNDPAAQQLPDQGPIPVGIYSIQAPMDTTNHGPFAMRLTPSTENGMYGRSGFLIHGDSLEHPGLASEGCIVLARIFREAIWASGDHELQVISGITTPSDLDAGDL